MKTERSSCEIGQSTSEGKSYYEAKTVVNLNTCNKVNNCIELNKVCCLCEKYGSKRKPLFTRNNVNLQVTVCEVQKHRQEDDLWIINNKNVYDVTSYQHEHPGGKFCLLKRSRFVKDTNEDFTFHSKKGRQQWETFKVAELIPCEGLPSSSEDYSCAIF